MKKNITLEFTNYVIKGTANCTYWDGTDFSIPMKPYNIDSLEIEKLLSGVNDNEFGCQSINSVEIDIYENYEGYLVFLEERELEVPKGYGHRGIDLRIKI